MIHDQLCLGCKCEDNDHWIDCTCRCATISRIREQIAKEIEEELGGYDDQDTLRKCAAIARGQK